MTWKLFVVPVCSKSWIMAAIRMAKISKSVNQLWRSSRRKIQRGNCIKKLSKREKKWNALGLNRGYFVVTKGGWEHKEWWDSSSIFWLPLEIKRWQSSSDTKGMTNCYSRRLRWRSSWRNCLKTQEKNKWKKSIESSSWTVLVTRFRRRQKEYEV